MRNLDEITAAVRLLEEVSVEEMARAIVAYDVLLAQLNLSRYPELLAQYFLAAETDVKEYAGPYNDYDIKENREWYREFHGFEVTPVDKD